MKTDRLRSWVLYYRDKTEFKRQMELSESGIPLGKKYPCLKDRFERSGIASGHYFHQDLLVARDICRRNPAKHVDVGSRIDGFVAHVASYREIEVLDIRPIGRKVTNIIFTQADMMSPLPEQMNDYCDSLSCLHAIEHFGLGRYGDPVNVDGHLRGLENLRSLLKPRGTLYLSCPIGPLRVEFNAHRVFSIEYLLDLFAGDFEISGFSYVDDHGDLKENIELSAQKIKNNCDCHYGCGIFTLEKA